jgi:hypothetical protein
VAGSLSSLEACRVPAGSACPFAAACPFTDGTSADSMSAGADPSSLRKWMACIGWIGCGMLGGVQDRSWDSAGALATMITPTTSATIPAACIASRPGDT